MRKSENITDMQKVDSVLPRRQCICERHIELLRNEPFQFDVCNQKGKNYHCCSLHGSDDAADIVYFK